MSVKIKVSYTDEEELAGVIRLLSPVMKSYKVAKGQQGVYKRAYIELKIELGTKPERSAEKVKKMNSRNLIMNSERSPRELREMGRKGGIKSGESRRRKKQARETAEIMARAFLESEAGKKMIEDLGKMLPKE